MVAIEKLAGLLGLSAFVLAGLGWLELSPSLSRLPWGRRIALAYLLGIAWTGGALYAASHLFSLPLRRPVVLAVLAMPAAAGIFLRWRRRRERASTPPSPRRRSPLGGAVFLLSALIFAGILSEVITDPLRDWDGRMTWAAQARYVRAEGTVDAQALRQPRVFVTHPRYPLLLPLAQVATLELAGAAEDSDAFRPLYAAFFPVLLALVYGCPRRRVSRSAAALAAFCAAVLPFVASYPGGGAVSAYSDLPLACFYGAGLLLLLEPRIGAAEGLVAGLLLAAAVLSKTEGAPLALAALFLGALVRRPRGGRRAPIGIAAAVVALALALLISWRAGIPNRYDEGYGDLLSLTALWPALVTRLPLLLSRIRLEMVAFKHWRLFWPMVPIVLLAGRDGLRRRWAGCLALAFLAPLGLAWLACAVHPDPAELVRTTWNRFLLQGFVPLLVLFSFALDDLLRRSPHIPRWLFPGIRRPAGSRAVARES
jgi:hypothetical protein